MTAEEFSEIIRTCEGYWPGREFPENTLDVWWSQMQAWRAGLVLAALPGLARDLNWLPSFSQLASAYTVQVTMVEHERERRQRHLHVAQDPEWRDRWRRVISQQLRTFGTLEDSDLGRAVRCHYRHDAATRGLIVLDAQKMLDDAELALADAAFGSDLGQGRT